MSFGGKKLKKCCHISKSIVFSQLQYANSLGASESQPNAEQAIPPGLEFTTIEKPVFSHGKKKTPMFVCLEKVEFGF